MNTTLIAIIVGVLSIFGIFLALIRRYKRCPSDKLLVVYGRTGKKQSGETNTSKILHGGGTLVWPVIQDYAFLDLKPIAIEIPLKDALSKQNIPVSVPSTVTVAISSNPQYSSAAAEKLLGLERRAIAELAKDVIFGQMRQVIALMTVEEIISDRDAFLDKIRNNLENEMTKIGLELINVNIQDVKDSSGFIEALGQQAEAEVKNNAKVQVAEENRKGDIGAAKADKERRINVAAAESEAKIGEADAQKDAEIGSQKAASEQTIKTSELKAQAIQGENTAAEDIARTTAAREIVESDERRKSETAKKVNEANTLKDSYEAEKEAEQERAEKDKATYHADVIVPAQIEKEKVEIEADAEAERVRRTEKGIADGVFYQMEAAAKGDYERLSKSAEGIKELVEAAGSADDAVALMVADKLEDLTRISVDAIKNIKFDNITVWDTGGNGGEGGTSTANFLTSIMKDLPAFDDVFKMAGKELPAILQGAGTKTLAELNAQEATAEEEIVDEDDVTDVTDFDAEDELS